MILAGQIRAYASASMPEDNITISGGAIDLTTAIDFADMLAVDQLQVVSSNSGDTQSVMIFGRTANGIINSEWKALAGTTPSPTVITNWERIMKVVKSDPTLGDVAVEQVTPVASGSIQVGGSSVDTVTLDIGASAQDNAYVGLVLRVTSGLGVGSIAKVLAYNGATQQAVLDKTVTFDTTSNYLLSRGVILNKNPHEIMIVRRPFYNAVASPSGGASLTFYEKFFWRNDGLDQLSLAQVQEVLNVTGKILFGIDPTIPSVSSVANRLTPPIITGLNFGRIPQSVPTNQSILASGQACGVWLSFAVNAGQNPQKLSYLSAMSGQTS